MGTFCEAFGVKKLEAPSTVRKRINKKRTQTKRSPRRPKLLSNKPNQVVGLVRKRRLLKNKRNPLFATNVEKRATNPFSAKLNKK